MRTRKKRSSRVLALLLSVMMVATSLSQTVIAEEISVNTPESTTSELSEAEKATPTAEPTEAPEASERPLQETKATEAPEASERPLQEVSPEPSPTVSAEPSAVPTEDLQVGQKARSARAEVITVTINGGAAVGGDSLQVVVEANGGATSVTSLKITAGNVTVDDWKYLKSLSALAIFEIDAAVTEVANIPDDLALSTTLTSVIVPQAITIGNYTFYECTELTSVSFPKATSIGENAFYRCPALKSASFPAVTSIAFNAFAGCTAITTLNLGATPPTTIGYNAFKDCPATRILGYMNADGTALTGDALTAAQAAYKAIGDGNTTDLLWYGWTIGTATPTATPTTSPTATPTGKIKLDLPKLQNGRYVYTGSAIEVQLAGFDGDLMTIKGNSATEIGNYKVVIGLKDTDKYEWNTDINKYGSWEFTWEIVKTAATPAPTIDPSAKPTAVPTATSSAVPSPKTGDSNDNLFIWVFLMVAAFSVIVIICVRIIKKRSDYNGRHGA